MPPPSHVVAIIGGGFSGAALATYLLTEHGPGLRLHIVEPRAQLGQGWAFGDGDPSHLLNVPAGRMSLYVNGPNDFLNWARSHGPALGARSAANANAASYLPRRLYGHYLKARLEDAAARARDLDGASLTHHATRLRRLAAAGGGFALELDDGATLNADTVVLATGFRPPALSVAVSGGDDRIVADIGRPGALDGIATADRVLLLGSGLAMVDAIHSLERRRHRGPVTAISPLGLLPFSRGVSQRLPPLLSESDVAQGVRHALTKLRAIIAAGEADWRSAVDSLRPALDGLWTALAPAEQDRFLRHLGAFWEAHRHRIPAEAADLLLRRAAAGQLRVEAGRVLGISRTPSGLDVLVRRRGAAEAGPRQVDWVVNCAPPPPLFAAPRDEFIEALLVAGLARPNRTGRGFDTDAAGRLIAADGKASDGLFSLGQPRWAYALETTPITTIRPQLEALSALLRR